MFSLKTLCRRTSRSRRDAGTAALELGLLAPFLLVLVVGTIELGMAICEAMQMQAAAETGAFYASKYGFDEVGITAAVTNATNATGVTATAVEFCGCPSAGGLTDEGAPPCSTTCTGGGAAGKYVLITARIAHFTVIPAPLPGLTIPAMLSGRAIVRLQ